MHRHLLHFTRGIAAHISFAALDNCSFNSNYETAMFCIPCTHRVEEPLCQENSSSNMATWDVPKIGQLVAPIILFCMDEQGTGTLPVIID